MRTILLTLALPLWLGTLSPKAQAQGKSLAIDTNGISFEVNHSTGDTTKKSEESLNNFNLGATARNGDQLLYVAAHGGGTEPQLHIADTKTGAISHIDLDRDDPVRALFFDKKKLYGVFYNGNLGTAGIYRINQTSGVTTLVLDLSDLDLEPIPGAVSSSGSYFYMLARPEAASQERRLIRFRTRGGTPKITAVTDADGAIVQCDKLQPNTAWKGFMCLASDTTNTVVNACRLSLSGRARCLKTLLNILRVGTGHTMLTLDQKSYFAFVYVPNEPNNQHLIKFNSRGVMVKDFRLTTIMLGAHFRARA